MLLPLLLQLKLLQTIMKMMYLHGNKYTITFVRNLELFYSINGFIDIFILATNQIKNIHRNKQVQTVYDQWMKDTLATFGTIENYLLTTKLKFETMTDPTCPPVIILPNDFPYSVTPGIHHILLWSQIPLTRPYIQHILESNYGSYEWVYFVNPPEIQSVRKLPHVHVFMRRRLNY